MPGNPLNQLTCGAKSKRAGRPCQAPAMPNGRCHKHGGATPSGLASPQFRDGRYSKYLPTGLLERYATAVQDPDLLALRSDISLVDARLSQLVERLKSHESSAIWKALAEALAKLDAASEWTEQEAAKASLKALVRRGAQAYPQW